MTRKNFHNTEFDNGTLIKLHVFKEYLKAWLPVFIKKDNPYWKKIFIYDFFAGEGKDGEGNSGSPLIIIDELRSFCKDIKSKEIQLKVVLNEFDKKKKDKLLESSYDYLEKCRKLDDAKFYCPSSNNDNECVFQLIIENNDFKEFFQGIYSTMIRYPKFPRLMFLDQFGIKQIDSDIFGKLISLDRTDFIFFISSFHARRFVELPEFKKYLDISKSDFDDTKSYQCHRVIFDYYKSQLPSDKEFYLAPFSIKKGANIYGLIFGTHHKLGIEKFLRICWKINPNTGDANFDIDNEKIDPQSPKLFAEFEIPSKLELFSKNLEEKILHSDLKTTSDIYTFTFDMGCLPIHANKVLNELIKSKKIQPVKTATTNVHLLNLEQIVILKP